MQQTLKHNVCSNPITEPESFSFGLALKQFFCSVRSNNSLLVICQSLSNLTNGNKTIFEFEPIFVTVQSYMIGAHAFILHPNPTLTTKYFSNFYHINKIYYYDV